MNSGRSARDDHRRAALWCVDLRGCRRGCGRRRGTAPWGSSGHAGRAASMRPDSMSTRWFSTRLTVLLMSFSLRLEEVVEDRSRSASRIFCGMVCPGPGRADAPNSDRPELFLDEVADLDVGVSVARASVMPIWLSSALEVRARRPPASGGTPVLAGFAVDRDAHAGLPFETLLWSREAMTPAQRPRTPPPRHVLSCGASASTSIRISLLMKLFRLLKTRPPEPASPGHLPACRGRSPRHRPPSPVCRRPSARHLKFLRPMRIRPAVRVTDIDRAARKRSEIGRLVSRSSPGETRGGRSRYPRTVSA